MTDHKHAKETTHKHKTIDPHAVRVKAAAEHVAAQFGHVSSIKDAFLAFAEAMDAVHDDA